MSKQDPIFTPNKKNSVFDSQNLSRVRSSHKVQKVSIDRFGGVHREQYAISKKMAPLVRVDVQEQQYINDSGKKQYSQKIQILRNLSERIDRIKNEKKNQMLKIVSKEQRIKFLMTEIENNKRKNQERKKEAIRINNINQQMRSQKLIKNNSIKELNSQVDQKIILNERDELQTSRQLKINELNINTITNQLVLPQQQLRKMNPEIKLLENQEEEICEISQKKLATIRDLNVDVKKMMTEVGKGALQLSILKMQINPKLRVGFTTISLDPDNDRLKILDKQFHVWSKNKTRTITNNQIRDYLIMQLYPYWKKMLDRISCDYIGYQQLLCYQQDQEETLIQDLSIYLPKNLHNQSQDTKNIITSKDKNFIVLYSPIPQRCIETLKIVTDLVGVNNGIIHIQDVKLGGLQNGNQELTIQYDYGQTFKVKKIQVIILQQLTKEQVMKHLPMKKEKNVLMKLEVPLISPSFSIKSQYEQVYELLRRWA